MLDLPIRIAEKRREAGLNKTKLGEILGVSGTAIKQYEDGKNYPKTEVLLAMSKVLKWDFINDKPLESTTIGFSNENVTQENKLQRNVNNLSTQETGFNDIGKLNSKLIYAENSTFPGDNKNMPKSESERKSEPAQWRQLYNISQQKITLLNREIELLNQLIQQ